MNNIIMLPVGESLGDSWLISYAYSATGEKLTLLIKLWTEKILEISFVEPILFFDEGYEYVEFLCENKDKENKLISNMIKKIERSELYPISNHSYRLFQFVEVDQTPSMQIIATDFHCKIYDEMQ